MGRETKWSGTLVKGGDTGVAAGAMSGRKAAASDCQAAKPPQFKRHP